MQRATNTVARSALRSAIRAYTPGKVIMPEHVLKKEKVAFVRHSFIGQWLACGGLVARHFFPGVFGCALLVFWAKGGFSGQLPPPLD